MKKQGNKVLLKTPNYHRADPRGTNGEESKHNIAELYEMTKEELKKT